MGSWTWFMWDSAFLVPWALLYWRFPVHRRVMRWSSLFTAPFGLTEPLFVPRYWDPPSLLDLAKRTGFDIESLIFCFGIGGVASVLVNVLTGRVAVPLSTEARQHPRHIGCLRMAAHADASEMIRLRGRAAQVIKLRPRARASRSRHLTGGPRSAI